MAIVEMIVLYSVMRVCMVTDVRTNECNCDLKFCNHVIGCVTGKCNFHAYEFFFYVLLLT